MIDPILSLAHTIRSGKGTMALLLGSGISRSAGIPTGWEVTLELVRRLAAMLGEDAGTDPAAWYETRHGAQPGYSELLDALAKTPAERRNILHEIFEPSEEEREQGLKQPTRAHRAVAGLVAKGFVRVIVTTNFDRLIELALQDAGVTPVVVATADAVLGAAPIVHQGCVVLKVHGDYLDGRIKNTDAELGSYDPAMDRYLDRILDEFGLVVCGWSGEWDPALRAAIERCPSRRYATYWTGTRTPGPRATALAQLRGAQFIEIKGADEFFGELLEKVTSLEEMGSAAPLSVGAAVASVKRYIAEPRHVIRFDDLLSGEARRVRAEHEAKFTLNERPYNAEAVRKRFLAYDASTEVLRHMLFHAARWAGPEHHEPILRTIASLSPPENAGGTVGWLNMRVYPAALAFYAACAGAEVSGNYRLLDALFRLQFRFNGHRGNALPDLTAFFILGKDLAQAIHEKPRHTPMSDHLSTVVAPIMASVALDGERAFDRLEVMIALAQVDRNNDPSADTYLPHGRFSWRHHEAAYAEVFEEAELSGTDWPPLKAGMFHGKPERVVAVKEAFMDKLKRASSRFW